MDWKITLVGGQDAGKTSYFGALHASHQYVSLNRLVTQSSHLKIAEVNGISEQVLFALSGYAFENDKTKLDDLALGLTRVPIEWPTQTIFGHQFPVDFSFRRWSISGKIIGSRTKRIQIVDVPGEAFSPDPAFPEEADRAIRQAIGSEALIVFVDMDDIKSGGKVYSSSKSSLSDVIREASKLIRFEDTVLPVSLVFTKFDKIPKSYWPEAHQRIFEEIVIPLSRIDSRMVVMSCPMSLISLYPDRFDPINVEYPFLFSTVGIILGQSLETATNISATQLKIRSSGWFARLIQGVFDGKGVSSMKLSERIDLSLVKSILQSIRLDQLLGRTNVRFCHNGEETKIENLLRGLLR